MDVCRLGVGQTQGGRSELELLKFQESEALQATHILGEVGSLAVLLQGSLVLPGLAYHEDIRTGGTWINCGRYMFSLGKMNDGMMIIFR